MSDYLWEDTPAEVPCWHIHHDTLLEWSKEPLHLRAKFIKAVKPEKEIEARLRLMRPVKGKLPDEVTGAYGVAEEATARAWWTATWDVGDTLAIAARTQGKLKEIISNNRKAIEELHRKECPDCPWNGETIFPEEDDAV